MTIFTETYQKTNDFPLKGLIPNKHLREFHRQKNTQRSKFILEVSVNLRQPFSNSSVTPSTRVNVSESFPPNPSGNLWVKFQLSIRLSVKMMPYHFIRLSVRPSSRDVRAGQEVFRVNVKSSRDLRRIHPSLSSSLPSLSLSLTPFFLISPCCFPVTWPLFLPSSVLPWL